MSRTTPAAPRHAAATMPHAILARFNDRVRRHDQTALEVVDEMRRRCLNLDGTLDRIAAMAVRAQYAAKDAWVAALLVDCALELDIETADDDAVTERDLSEREAATYAVLQARATAWMSEDRATAPDTAPDAGPSPLPSTP